MARASATVRIGISGWRYAPWRGVFYPEGLTQKRELEYASRMFTSIEINGTFYSLQRPEFFQRWRNDTPDGFVFAVKAPRYITHIRRLREIDTPLANFFASGVSKLGDRLGPILWQLPPSLRYDAQLLEDFCAKLPRTTHAAQALARRRDAERMRGRSSLTFGEDRPLRHAMEVRHGSFLDEAFVALLRRYGIALVVADTAGRWPYVEDVTADFMYLRLHGDVELYVSGYTPEALDRWAERIRAWADGGEPVDAQHITDRRPRRRSHRDICCYFDNDAKVKAPFDALSLARRLGLLKKSGATPVAPLRDCDAATRV